MENSPTIKRVLEIPISLNAKLYALNTFRRHTGGGNMNSMIIDILVDFMEKPEIESEIGSSV